MDLETKTSLWDGNKKITEQGDKVKIFLKSEEIIIGDYDVSDLCSLTIVRDGANWEFDLDDIENIEVLKD